MKFILSFLSFLAMTANAGVVTGKISRITIHGDNWGTYTRDQEGVAMFYMNSVPPACGDGARRVVISTGHPSYEAALSIAMSAQARGTNVEINYLENCSVRGGAWTFGVISSVE